MKWEWRRVFSDKNRLGILLLMTVLCAAIFAGSLLDSVGPDGIERTRLKTAYILSLVERWREEPLADLPRLAQAEENRLDDVRYWYIAPDWAQKAFQTESETIASVSDLTELAGAMEDGDRDRAMEILLIWLEAVRELRDEAEYAAGYGAYLSGVQANAEMQSQSAIFSKHGSFANRNLKKTARDFEKILGVEVQFGANRGVEKWLDFRLGGYFHLIAMVLFVMAFLEERKRGLWPVVRATRGGRARLGVTRLGILLAASLLATVLFDAIPLIISLSLNGGWGGLGRPLQSVMSFGTCPIRTTIAGWLGIYFTLRVLFGAFLGILIWCILGMLSNIQFSVSVLGVILVTEFALYTYLPVQSILNGFKYVNIFSFVHTSTLFTEYLNVDMMGFPVGISGLCYAVFIVFGAGFAVLAVSIQRSRRPEGNRDILGRLSLGLNKLLDKVRTRLSVGGWEWWKTLAFQHGILLLAVVIIASGELRFTGWSVNSEEATVNQYLRDMEGPVDETTDDYIAHARESALGNDEASMLNAALDRVENIVKDLRQRAEEGGYEPWIVYEKNYVDTYGDGALDQQRLNAAAAILFTALLCAGLGAFERQAGVTPMLRSVKRGRATLLRRKMVTAAVLSLTVWALVYGREVWQFISSHGTDTLAASVRNISDLADFPINTKIGGYLVILYALRLTMLIGVGEAVLYGSFACPTVRTSYIVCLALFGIPAILTVLGVEVFKWMSPIIPVSSAELLWGMGDGRLINILPWVVWLAFSSGVLYLVHRKWVGCSSSPHSA